MNTPWRRLLAGSLTGTLPAVVLAQQATTVSGTVLSDANAPINGASVSIPSLALGAVTNAEGRYSFVVPAGRAVGTVTLSVRRLGYVPANATVTLGAGTVSQNFSLTQAASQLSGVVVTALSQVREKQTIGTSQQALSDEELTRVKTPNLVSNLSGKVSGVQIAQSGNIGGTSRIVIRGQGSILGQNQPLFIVDGLPVSNRDFSTGSASNGRDYGSAIQDINPDDVASITVLKGPNAAALYGSRASNGAIVITTKNGRNQTAGTKINLTSRYTADDMSIFPKYQNQYGQGFIGEFNYKDGRGNGVNDGADESWGPKLDGRLVDQFNGKQLPWVAHPDNVKQYFDLGRTVSNNVNVTASGRGLGARFSVTRDDIKGIVPNSKLGRTAASLNASGAIKEKLNISSSLQYTRNAGNRPEVGYTEGNPFMTFTWFGRQVDVASLAGQYYNAAGNPYGLAEGSLYNWNQNYHRNPYWQVYENTAPDNRERMIGQVQTTYDVASWLTGTFRAGGDSYRNTNQEFFAKGNIDRADASYNGGFTNNNSRAREMNFEGLLTARRSVGMLDLTGTLGGQQRKNDRFDNNFGTRGILVPGIYNLANAGIVPTVTNAEYHSAVNSTYGSAVVTVNRVWTIEGTGRNDWSSTLPKENASYFYPSVSSSLIVSDLFPVVTRGGVLTYLKLRGGWAQVGADADAYQLATTYNGSSNKFNGNALYTLANRSANAALKPERTFGSEGGVEMSFFNDRITFDGTYYLKQTRDQIIPLTVAPATGFSSAVINAGQMSNRGIEALLTMRPIQRANGFNWTSTINYTRNRNKVDELAPGLTTIVVASQWGANIEARQGEPYGVIFGVGWLRDAQGRLITVGGLPQQDPTKKILGNVNPDWVGGWGNEFRYRRFTLNSLIDVRKGGKNFSVGNWWGMNAGILESTLKGREIDWDKPGIIVDGIDKATGQPNKTVVTAEDYGHNLYPIHEPAIFSTGFVKLRELQLNWDTPTRFTRRLNVSQLTVGLIGRNLLTWTNFPNYDPENAANADNGGQGFDMGALPTTRNIGFNISVTP